MILYDIIISSIASTLILSFTSLFSEKIKEYIQFFYEKIAISFFKEITYKIEYNALIGKDSVAINLKIHDNSDMVISAIFLYLNDKINFSNYKGFRNLECKVTKPSSITYKEYYESCEFFLSPSKKFEYNKLFFTYVEDIKDNKINKKLYINVYNNTHTKEDIKDFLNICVKNYIGIVYKINTKLTFNIKDDSKFESYIFESDKTFDNIFIKDKKNIINLLNDLSNKKLNKLGFLFYGIPGCGKTSLIKCIANYTNRNIICINLMKIKDQSDLLNIFFKEKIGDLIIPLDKRIYIIEDIDCNGNITHKRTSTDNIHNNIHDNIHNNIHDNIHDNIHNNLTLSELLNCLDGILELKNSILIMTTNHKEKIDPALTRPGRINLEVELSYLDKKSISDMVFYHYKTNINEKYLIDGVFTPAQLENLIFISKDIFVLENKIELFKK